MARTSLTTGGPTACFAASSCMVRMEASQAVAGLLAKRCLARNAGLVRREGDCKEFTLGCGCAEALFTLQNCLNSLSPNCALLMYLVKVKALFIF